MVRTPQPLKEKKTKNTIIRQDTGKHAYFDYIT